MKVSHESEFNDFLAHPWMHYAGSLPDHILRAKKEGWRIVLGKARNGDVESMVRFACYGCRMSMPVKGYEIEHSCPRAY